jgi:transposase
MKRGRPFEIEWQESAEELFEAYRQEKNVHRRTRLQVLWQLRQGKSLGEVSKTTGMSYRTLQRWVSWYRSGGLAEVLNRTPGHAAHGRSGYLTPKQKEQVKAQADRGPFRTAREAAEWIEQQWGVRYKRGGIYGLFRHLKLMKKVPRPQSEKANPEAQEAWKKGGYMPPWAKHS